MHNASQTPPDVGEHAGYWEVVRDNTNFRRLWIGNLISLLGDWFNTIALYSLVSELTGSPFALGAVFITKMLPWALSSPLAGMVVDRFNRRRLMIAADLLRAVVVLGFLLIDEPGEVYLVYLLTTIQVMIGSVSQPARSASIPNITTRRELLTANALMSVTWSIMLAAGAALGGVATELFGKQAVFIIDSLTYVVSAGFLFYTVIPQATIAGRRGAVISTAYGDILEGWMHLRTNPRVARIAFAKAAWAVAGGGLVFMLTLLGAELSPTAQAVGIGILFGARGLGTGVGPVVVRGVFTDQSRWPAVLGGCIVLSGIVYATMGLVEWTYFVAFFVMTAHAASGANWVLTTVMLQERTVDHLRGRVFATEWLLVLAAESASIMAASSLLESGALSLRSAFLVFGLTQLACGLFWLAIVVPKER